ncbi:hypothetical protein JCM14469_14260 [Desulfatiferula olefinivorans]
MPREGSVRRAWGKPVWLVLVLIFTAPCLASALDTRGSVGVAQEFNDNLFFDQSDKTQSQVTVLLSSLDLSMDSEVMKSRLSFDLNYSFYERERELDGEDWNVLHDLTWVFSERTRISSTLGFEEETGIDRYLASTGVLLDTRDHRSLDGRVTVYHLLHERITVDFGVGVGSERFSDSLSGSSEDSLDSRSVSTGLTVQWNELTSLTVNGGYGYYDYETHTLDQSYAVVGLTRSFSETMSGFLSAGGRYTTYTYDVFSGYDVSSGVIRPVFREKHDHTRGWIGRAGLDVQGEDYAVRLSVDESLQPSTGQNQSLERTTVDLSVRKKLIADLEGRASAQYYLNRSDDTEDNDSLRFETFRIWTGLFYALTDDLSLSAQYSHLEYREKSLEKKRNIYRLSITYSF